MYRYSLWVALLLFLKGGYAWSNLGVRLRSKVIKMSNDDYGSIAHAGLLVADVKKSIDFYVTAFAFEDVTHLRNPELPFEGAFLAIGKSQLHLMKLPNPDAGVLRPEHGGRDRHFAISCRPGTVKKLQKRLGNLNHPYTMSRSGRAALFCRDLDANALEFMEVDDFSI
jgi:glyoxylase I family protein